MKRWRIRPGHALSGVVTVPGDKSIGHRAVLFAALAEGRSAIVGLSEGLDNLATRDAMSAMGVSIEERDGTLTVDGVGLRGLSMARGKVLGQIDCGNSGTTMRLLAGVLAAQAFGTRLVGDASLSARPMRRIVGPLRARGAHIAGIARPSPDTEEDEMFPPLSIAPLLADERLHGLEYEMSVASAQVKSAMLLSGLYAAGPTVLKEPTLSRDHTERMMVALGVPLETIGPMVCLDPSAWSGRWEGFTWQVPGDLSAAAFLVAAAHVVPKSDIRIEACGVNPTRSGLLDALRPMGSGVNVEWKGVGAGDEPMGDLLVSHAALSGGRTGGELLTRMIDEVPAFAAIAAVARRRTEIQDAKELRVKECDRLSAMSQVLRAFGVEHTEIDDGLLIDGSGGRPLAGGARVDSHGDHRIAMAAAILGLAADGETLVSNVDCVDTSFVGFAALLRGLGADIEEEEMPEAALHDAKPETAR